MIAVENLSMHDVCPRGAWCRRRTTILLALGLMASWAPAAEADATLFIGTTSTPSTRTARGFAVGVGLLVVGLEFEYAATVQDLLQGAPALTTTMGNVLVHTPTDTQLYATLGGGFYRETLDARQETHIGINMGGGVKLKLAGPLRLRLDYRIFALRGDPRVSKPQRFYAGANLAF